MGHTIASSVCWSKSKPHSHTLHSKASECPQTIVLKLTFSHLRSDETPLLFSYVPRALVLHSLLIHLPSMSLPHSLPSQDAFCILQKGSSRRRGSLVHSCIPSVCTTAWLFRAAQMVVVWSRMDLYVCDFRSWVSHFTTLNSSFFPLINWSDKWYLSQCHWEGWEVVCENTMEIINYIHVKCIYSCCSILIDLSRSRSNCIFFWSMFADHPNPKWILCAL